MFWKLKAGHVIRIEDENFAIHNSLLAKRFFTTISPCSFGRWKQMPIDADDFAAAVKQAGCPEYSKS
jgi:hypothetical protein